MRRRVAEARVGRLSTVRPDGAPHVVPIVLALHEDRIYTPVDAKPKRGPKLQRLRNIEVEPRVEILVDAYTEEWERLWWVRVAGTARPSRAGAEHDLGIGLLREKYPQYGSVGLEGLTVVEPASWRSWSGAGLRIE